MGSKFIDEFIRKKGLIFQNKRYLRGDVKVYIFINIVFLYFLFF